MDSSIPNSLRWHILDLSQTQPREREREGEMTEVIGDKHVNNWKSKCSDIDQNTKKKFG